MSKEMGHPGVEYRKSIVKCLLKSGKYAVSAVSQKFKLSLLWPPELHDFGRVDSVQNKKRPAPFGTGLFNGI